MSEAILTTATAALFAVLAFWVLGTGANHPTNRTLGALFLLFAGSTLAFQEFRARVSPDDGLVWIRLITWYEIPLPFLVLLLLDGLFAPRPRPRRWTAAIALAAAGTFGLFAAMALRPQLLHFTDGGPVLMSGTLAYLLGIAWVLVKGFAVVLAARVAADPLNSAMHRKLAGVVGLGFAVLLAHAAGLSVLGTALSRPDLLPGPYLLVLFADVGGGIVAWWAWSRLARPFSKGPGGMVKALPAVAFAAGVFDGLYALPFRPGLFTIPEYINSRTIWIAVFATALAVAAARYGLAGITPDGPRRVADATAVALVAAGAGLAGSVGWVAAGAAGALGGGALGCALALGALRATPLRAIPARVSERVLTDPDDVDVVRERARVYRAALRASAASRGFGASGDTPVLEALRSELGLTRRDHELLLADLAAPSPAASPVLLGRYFVQRELGQGATSVVLLARDSVLGREVVLKRLTGLGPEAASFAAEARALSSVSHPRVVRLFDVRQVGHEVVLVLEYAPGGNLGELLARTGPLPLDRAAALMRDVLEGLAVVHAAGIVHGDLKPANILLGRDGRAKLGDLGAAQVVRAAPEQTARLPTLMGTLGYAAPEQVLGDPATPASDVYAAGALLFRLLTGETYIDLDGASEAEARGRVLHRPPRLPHPGVPASVGPLLARALAKEPASRFTTADAMRAALADAAARAPRVSPP